MAEPGPQAPNIPAPPAPQAQQQPTQQHNSHISIGHILSQNFKGNQKKMQKHIYLELMIG